MAAVELSVLLFALINNIHAEEFMIQTARDSYTFNLTKEADFCLISRFVGEEKLVLWNTSDLWSKNSTVPEDLKQRLSVVSEANISSYVIHNLTHSDSGQYQEECWTEGKVTYEKKRSITICNTINETKSISVTLGGGVDLPCEGASDNLDIQWLKFEFRYVKDVLKGAFWDSTTSVIDNEKNTSVLRVSNFNTTVRTMYICLVMNQQQCVSSHPVQLFLAPEIIYHSVEEAAVLQCTVPDSSDDQLPLWSKFNSETKSYTEVGQNYSLSLPSLTLNHSGWYDCKAYISVQSYWLLVCPTFGPPVVELFSEGDEITVRCRDSGEGMWLFWFIKSNQTGGRIFKAFSGIFTLSLSRLSIRPNASLVISNASVEHKGEYWCAVIRRSDQQCVSTTKIYLKYREPFGIHSTFYTVRSSLLSGLLVVLCAVVVTVIQRTRRQAET